MSFKKYIIQAAEIGCRDILITTILSKSTRTHSKAEPALQSLSDPLTYLARTTVQTSFVKDCLAPLVLTGANNIIGVQRLWIQRRNSSNPTTAILQNSYNNPMESQLQVVVRLSASSQCFRKFLPRGISSSWHFDTLATPIALVSFSGFCLQDFQMAKQRYKSYLRDTRI